MEKKRDKALNEKYSAYINGEYELEMNEVFQLGFRIAKEAESYVGIDWLVWWYERNLILFSNLMELVASGDERILFIVGSGHVDIVGNFLRESGAVMLEPVQPYLV